MKYKLLVFQIIAFTALVECGRITGGYEAVRGQFPYHVKVEPFDGYSRRLCGGTLIKYNWILTAAQCIADARDIIVRLGVVDRLAGPESFALWIRNREDFLVHENYSADHSHSIYKNDIGLIYLEEANQEILNDAYVDIVALPNDYNIDIVSKHGIATGFGFYADGDDALQSMILRYVDMNVLGANACEQAHGTTVFTDTHFCTDTINGRSTCAGDEGGPFVTNIDGSMTIIGIASTPLQKCTQGFPALFTNILPFLDWIDDKVNGDVPITTLPPPTDPPSPTPPPNNGDKCNCVCNCYTCPPLPEVKSTKETFWKKQ